MGASLDLVRLPIVQPHWNLAREEAPKRHAGKVDSQDALPPLRRDMYERRFRRVDRFGAVHEVTITGHPDLGLPYGGDIDVALALIKLADDDRQRVLAGYPPRVVNGEFVGVTMFEILEAMGLESNGKNNERVRSALERLAHVRISTKSDFRNTSAVARALERGDAEGVALIPTRSRDTERVNREEGVTWLLEYRLQEVAGRAGETERWVGLLRLNPLFIDQALAGWAAWVDMDVFRALRGPYAKRLYLLCAVETAFGAPAPLMFALDQLKTDCPLPSGEKPARLIDRNLTPAFEALVANGVLSGYDVRKIGHGSYEFALKPGPVLLFARWLRGAAGVDLRETRTQFAFLRAFGFDARVARALIESDPHAVHEALRYACFVRETDPARVTSSWSAMIKERVEQNRMNAGTPGYDEWLESRLDSLTDESADSRDGTGDGWDRASDGIARVTGDDQPQAPLVFGDDPWGRTLASAVDSPSIGEAAVRLWLLSLRLVSLEDNVAQLIAPDDLAVERVRGKYATEIAALLSRELGAEVTLNIYTEDGASHPRL